MKNTIFVMLIVVSMVLGFIPIISENVEAANHIIEDMDALCGSIFSFGTPYSDALSGSDLLLNFSNQLASIGQRRAGITHEIARGYLSFNTSNIPENERIVSAKLYGRIISKNINEHNFDVQTWRVDYGTLDNDDWNVTGGYQGNWFNTSNVEVYDWVSMDLLSNSINKSGITGLKLNSSMEGTAMTPNFLYDLIIISAAGSAYDPYLQITTVTESEAVITYNFSQTSRIPTSAMVEYWDEHITSRLETGFEDGIFGPAWTIFGTPTVTASYAPFEGIYHAGASISDSGTGNHTFEAAIDGTGLYNLTLDYYRKVQDVGGGTVSFIVDWYNGTTWNELENLTTSELYDLSTWELDSSADNNPNLIFRFNITLTAGAINNGAWIDNAELITKSGFHQHSNSTIYPSEYTPHNATHEQIRYDVFITEIHPTLDSWILLNVNPNFTLQSHHPNTVNVTDEGGGVINITNQQHQDIYHNFWFTKQKDTGIGSNYSANIYPVEIIDWQTQDLYRYEIWHSNWSFAFLQMPNASFIYQSINPMATITQLNSTTYNISGAQENTWLHIWFTVKKSSIYPAFVSMKREVTGEGIAWGTWAVYVNEGSWTDETNMTRLPYQEIELSLGMTYCFSVYDYFPTPNFITNHTIIATGVNGTLFIDIPVPYSPLNFKSFRDDLTIFRIWFNASGTPFTDHIPGEEWYQMDIRGGQYMIAIDYVDTTVNGTATIIRTYYLNITANSNLAYTINIGTSQLSVIVTDVNGLEIEVDNILIWVIGDVFVNRTVWPITITDRTRSVARFTADLPILIHPYSVIDAKIYSNVSGVTSATFFKPTPDTGTITIISDELIIMSDFDARIYINRTGDSSNIISASFPGIFDLTSYVNSTNITFWSNKTSSIRRETHFQQASVFFWKFTPQIGKYETSLSLNNTGSFNWREVEWYIGIPEGVFVDLYTPGRLPAIYDNDNKEWWELGLEYQIETEGFYTDFAFINSSVIRSITLLFFEANSTFYPGSAKIEISEYERQGVTEDSFLLGTGTFLNLEVGTHRDDLWIVLKNLDGKIIDSTFYVLDAKTGNKKYNVFITHSSDTSTTLRMDYNDVGDIPNGESFSVEVYFQYESIVLAGFPWVAFIIVAFFILVIAGIIIAIAKKNDKPILILGTIIMTSIIIIIAMIMFALQL